MQISMWTGLLVLAVGIYDIAYAINRSKTAKKRSLPFIFLGVLFIITGIVALIIGKR